MKRWNLFAIATIYITLFFTQPFAHAQVVVGKQSSNSQRSVFLHNYGNWGMDGTSAATLQNGLELLAKRDKVLITERRQRWNSVPGWDGITPQSLKALHRDIKVYMYYSLMTKSYPDTDWTDPNDTSRMEIPVKMSDIEANDWWLRDGNGDIVEESDVSWVIDVGKPGFKEAYLKGCLERIKNKGYDGFVFDYWWPSISYWLKSNPRPADYPTDEDWYNKAWKPFITYLMNGVHKAGYRIIGNACGEFGTTNLHEGFDRSKVDGTVYEQGVFDWWQNGSGWLPGSVLEQRINSIANDPLEVWVADAGLRDYVDNYDSKQAVSLAYYYIAIPLNQSKRCYHHEYDWMPFWQPLWDFYIGIPQANPVKQPGKYQWTRKYTSGLVVLNYESSSNMICVLDRLYKDSSGRIMPRTVVVPPYSALILQRF